MQTSYNAKISAIALIVSSLALAALTLTDVSLAPIRLFTLMLMAFAVWAFCDEMGLRKPLNRAGFVLFVFAIAARAVALVNISSPDVARYYILYAFTLTGAILFWSVAFLHRKKNLKVVGAIGVGATLVPIILLLIGHIVVGSGAAYGITSLFEALNQTGTPDPSVLHKFDFLFVVWAMVTSVILWRGLIFDDSMKL